MVVLSMDPNNQNPQVDVATINKLEEDLKNLNEQVASASQQPTPVALPVAPLEQMPPATTPVLSVPNVPDQPVMSPPVAPVEVSPPIAPVNEVVKKGSPLMIVAIILAVVAVLAVVAYVFGAKFLVPKTAQVACTMEAKICPDGSSVGRVAPNCEFAACPVAVTTPDPTINWKTYTNSEIGFSLKYPQEWTLQATTSSRVVSFDTKSGAPGEFFISYLRNIPSLPQWLLDNKAGETIDTEIVGTNQFIVIKGGSLNVSREYALKTSTSDYMRLVIEPYPNSAISDVLIKQILSSLRFGEKTPIASPTASPSSSPIINN